MHSGSYLRIRDLGEHGGQALGQQHCSPAPQQGLRWTYRLIPNHLLPLFLPAATLPPLSLSLCFSLSASFSLSVCPPACTGAVYRTGPQWPWVINGAYGADCFLPSTVVCCCCSSLYLLSFLPQHCRNPKKTPATVSTAASWKPLHYTGGRASPAVRLH